MSSTTVTTVGGVVIVTQVIPKEDASIPLQAPPPEQKAPPPVPQAPPTKADTRAAIFLRVEPQGLGVVQIFIGLLCVLWSLSAAVSPFLLSYAPFALGGFFVLSGSLAVASARHTSIRLVWVSLLAQVWGGLVGVAGLAYLGLLLTSDPALTFCQNQESCVRRLWTLDVVLRGLAGLLCVLLVLQVCVCVGVAAAAVQTARRMQRYQLMEVSEDGRSLLSSGEEAGKA